MSDKRKTLRNGEFFFYRECYTGSLTIHYSLLTIDYSLLTTHYSRFQLHRLQRRLSTREPRREQGHQEYSDRYQSYIG